jgi:hypothetical protein
MTRLSLLLGAALIGVAGVATAQATNAEKASLRSAMAEVGCVVDTEALRQDVMKKVGIDEARLGVIAGTMAMAGEFVEVPNGIKIVTGPCG